MKETYLRYGVENILAEKLENISLSKTTFEKTSSSNLIKNYGLKKDEIELVKSLIKRKPIEPQIIEILLKNSNFTCCVCKGVKGKSYIIHHIEEYSISQDNNYQNLAVLCPTCHDSAHKVGKSLSLKLTKEQIIKQKNDWEKQVVKINIQQASRNGNIFEIDFINVPRILELYRNLFNDTPNSEYSKYLIENNLIDKTSNLNYEKISEVNQDIHTPLIFWSANGSGHLSHHYYSIFKEIINYLEFENLDDLLNKAQIKKGITGKYCFYIGGLYSSKLPKEIEEYEDKMKFHLSKKSFSVQWLVDPKYFVSSSAKWRTSNRTTYMIFGKVRNTEIGIVNGKKKIIIDIRPYCFGLPEKSIDRKPEIAYLKEIDSIFEEEE